MEEKEILIKIGKNLRSIRERRGMTAEDIGHLLNISQDAIRKYERGERDPGIARILKAQSEIGCSIMTILSGVMDGSDAPEEYNVLSADASKILHRLATSWDGDIDALIIYMGMIAAMPEIYRREIYMAGTVMKDALIAKHIINKEDLPEGIEYMENALGYLYKE